jgi:hypothetical protein
MSDFTEFEEVYFFSLFGILLGHIVCKHGLLVDQAKIAVILDLEPPTSVKQLREALGHTGYYKNLSKGMCRS